MWRCLKCLLQNLGLDFTPKSRDPSRPDYLPAIFSPLFICCVISPSLVSSCTHPVLASYPSSLLYVLHCFCFISYPMRIKKKQKTFLQPSVLIALFPPMLSVFSSSYSFSPSPLYSSAPAINSHPFSPPPNVQVRWRSWSPCGWLGSATTRRTRSCPASWTSTTWRESSTCWAPPWLCLSSRSSASTGSTGSYASALWASVPASLGSSSASAGWDVCVERPCIQAYSMQHMKTGPYLQSCCSERHPG